MRQSEPHAPEAYEPIRPDPADRAERFRQRDALLGQLGIVPRLLRSTSILELGPGRGENALHLLEHEPELLVLVEADPERLLASAQLLGEHAPESTVIECVQASAEEFDTDEEFDLVLFEDVLPFEADPESLLEHTARFVAPGGILGITCSDAVALFPEALRRLIGLVAAPPELDARDRVALLTPIFAPHLATVAGTTHAPEDWVLDQLVRAWAGSPLSILDAARALAPDLELHGTSPTFLTAGRWARDAGVGPGGLRPAEEAYRSSVHNLVDARFARPRRDPAENDRLVALCRHILARVRAYEAGDEAATLEDVARGVEDVRAHLAGWAPETADALEDYQRVLDRWSSGLTTRDFGRFTPLFGRGQQHASFLRRSHSARRAA